MADIPNHNEENDESIDDDEIVISPFSEIADENDLINIIFTYLYNEGDYIDIWLYSFLTTYFSFKSKRDYAIFWKKIKDTGFVDGYADGKVWLTDFGITTLKKYKTYSDYLIAQKNKEEQEAAKRLREERERRHESFPKRNWLLIAACTYVSGILSILIVEYCKQKIMPEGNQSKQPIQSVKDTLQKPKPHDLNQDNHYKDSSISSKKTK